MVSRLVLVACIVLGMRPGVRAQGTGCCSLCSCDEGCNDCDPYPGCPTGGCNPDGQGGPLDGCCPHLQAPKMNVTMTTTTNCCSLCSCNDGCTDCDPYPGCPTGGCEPGDS